VPTRGEKQRSMARDVREIGNAVLDAGEADDLQLTNLALNKIVFFAHAWHLACHGEPLIDSLFEAWQYGPVHPQIHRQLKRFGNRKITTRLTRIDMQTGRDVLFTPELSDREKEMVMRVTSFYGRYSAAKLVELSHEAGAPWDQVWQ